MFAKLGESGRDMCGLCVYLFGPGKANEHTNPHAIASSKNDFIAQAYRDDVSAQDARDLGGLLEAHFVDFIHAKQNMLAASGVGSRGGASGHDRNTDVQPHVFHAALSIAAEDGVLTDAQWHDLAHDYVHKMFPEEGDLEWIAVRHGLTTRGNDHIHIALNLVNEQGTYANVRQSKIRSRDTARFLEEKYPFLRPMAVDQYTRATGHYHRAERELNPQVKEHAMLPARRLARTVRSAAMVAKNEREFLAQLSERGVAFAPRWQQGGTEKVIGYSVKFRDDTEDVWRGGGKLARDLTLTQLRARWEQTPEQENAARMIWSKEKLPPVRPSVNTVDADKAIGIAVHHLDQWRKEISELDPQDRMAWKKEAARLSGVFGELGDRYEGKLGRDMRWMARRYERLAQDREHAPVTHGQDNAEKAISHIDLAFNSVTILAPGSQAALMAGAIQIARAAQSLETTRAQRIATERELESHLAEIKRMNERRARVEATYRELSGTYPQSRTRHDSPALPEATYPTRMRGQDYSR